MNDQPFRDLAAMWRRVAARLSADGEYGLAAIMRSDAEQLDELLDSELAHA